MHVGGMPHIVGKLLTRATTFFETSTSIECLHKKLWSSKMWRVPRQNDIWMQPLWLIIENTIRGKVVASLKFGLW